MPDRSPRLLTLPQPSAQGGERSGVFLRERPASPPDAPSGGQNGDERGRTQEDNPFAPPPEGSPDRPWQPRRPSDDGEGGDGSRGRSPWGRQWSDRQPGRSGGGFGERPGASGSGQDGSGGGPAPGPRWDPTDPVQRRARYALLCGMWAFFFALFSWPSVALLLGALALYWGITTLRAKPRTPDPDNAAPEQTGRPQTTAAVSGLVTGSLALALVAASFTAQLVYSEYYTCTNDALTHQSREACADLLPKELRGFLGTGD
ncbi:hypothetical protein [Streptomyces sp. DH24]|uniref:hypothetical protein n=1 Tax=Streptomyces sp. DH24 TaxID=3040123 RepID=UPI002441DC44|nr:hypothetical protein [Streptomyces sp. DH24]MDG9720914.1 hypothetical protein [Streptomyces sp. DH24]